MKERAIFDAALSLEDPAERAAYLDRECGHDSTLRQRMAALLDALPKLDNFLEWPLTPVREERAAKPGDMIGNYKLLQQVGEGGFGIVYMAEQQRPVRRKVALKIIKAGMDSREVIARFEAERQALAMMDHPNISRVLDAGTTAPTDGGYPGWPYVVMDLVCGSPITEYCDHHQLTLSERLKLFVPVCRAIQHAHQKGIIHRDIKPSNILITSSDGEPTPKVIDFGVAKAVDHRLTDRTLFTRFGQVVGTLEYMSPEQAEMGGLDVDTRSDVYSLGVVLYELLTGSTPLQRSRLKGAAFDELLRIIREEEPAAPSDRISQSGDDLAAISAQRRMEPKKIGAFVRGELDWVVMKALEKNRSRRFATANEFAEDIEHFLHGEPVTACPPSLTYRLEKLARKHLGLIVATSVLLVVLLVTTPISIWQAVRATQAQFVAGLERDQAREARDAARKSRDSEFKAHTELMNAYQQLSEQQAKTSEAHRRALGNEARLAAETGHSLIDRGRTREGMLWLVRALTNMPADEEVLSKFVRLNIAAAWDDIPQPTVASFEISEQNAEQVRVMDADPNGRFVSLFSEPMQPPRIWTSGPEGNDPRESHFDMNAAPQSLAFLPGRSLLSMNSETTLDRWNLDTGKPLDEKLIDDNEAIDRVYVDPAMSRVFVLYKDLRRAQLIEATSGRVLGTVEAAENGYLVAPSGGYGPFSPEGDAVAIVEVPFYRSPEYQNSTPRIIAVTRLATATGEKLSDRIPLKVSHDQSQPFRYTVGPKAEFVLVAVPDNRTGQTIFRQFDARGQSSDSSFGETAAIGSLAIAPNGLVLAAGSTRSPRGTTDIKLWSLAPNRKLIGEITTGTDVDKLRFDGDSRYLFTLGRVPIVRWSVPESRLCSQLLPHGAAIQALSLSDDGSTVLTISGRQASRWKFSTGELLLPTVQIPLASSAARAVAAFTPDGNTLLLADGAVLQRWDMRTGQPAGRPISAPYDIAKVAVDRSGRRVMCVCAVDQTKPETHVFDIQSGERIGRPIRFLCVFDWNPNQPGITQGAVALSPDGTKIVATHTIQRLRCWDATGEAPRDDALEFRGMLTQASFTPDGRYVLACINHQTFELRDSASGQRVGQLINLDRPLRAFAVSPDGQVLAAAVDGQIQTWFLETGESLGKPILLPNATALCFSHNGEMLLAGDAQGLVRTWHVFRHLPAEALTIATVEALTGLQLTEDGVVRHLDLEQWRARFASWKKLRETQLGTTIAALPGIFEATLEARTPEEWQTLQSGLDREAERPSGCIARLFRARSQLEAQQPEKALEDVKKAIELGPRIVAKNWLSNLARHDIQQGQRDRARWYLDRMVEFDLADADVCMALSVLHVAENRRGEPNAWLQRATDMQPTSTAVLRSVGQIEFHLGQWESAAARLTRALELGGGNAEVWKLRAACFAELGRWDQAADDLGKAVQRHPRIAELREQLAIALVSAGNLAGYRELCVETLANLDLIDYARRPWTVPAHLALASGGLSDYQPIIKPAQDFADKYADGCVSPHILAPYCYRSGQYEQAAQAKLPVHSSQVIRPEVLIFFAMARAKTGDFTEAKRKLAEVDTTSWQQSNVWERQRIRLLLAEAEPLISSLSN